MNDLETAKNHLKDSNSTLVLCKGDKIIFSEEKGVSPMLNLLEEKTDLYGFSAADRVVGKAAAMLFSLAEVKEIYAEVISRPAAEFLTQAGITFSYGEMTEYIINRKGDGKCPMELAVMDISDPADGHAAIIKRLNEIRKDNKT